MELIKAENQKIAFQNIFNLYAHELSEYNASLSTQIDKDGNYLTDTVQAYLDSSKFESYCIMENNSPIGIAVFSSEMENDEWYHDIEEIFLINTSRHQGIAENICIDFWDWNIGIGTLHVLLHNKKAIHFWDKLSNHCGYRYSKSINGTMIIYRFPLLRQID